MTLLTSISTDMYEVFIGPNVSFPEYRDGIFSAVGLMTLLLSIAVCAVFYAMLGRWKPVFHKPLHWIIALALTAVAGFIFAWTQAAGTIASTDSYTFRFGLFNALYAALYFTVFSLLLKRVSIFAKHTPL
jgi:hypothetical protein